MAKQPISSKTYGIEVVRRSLRPPAPGSAEARFDYTRVFGTRAEVKTRSGTSEFGRIEFGGKTVTHTFTIRWTSIPFDTRDRVRNAAGQLWQILHVEDVDLKRIDLRIHCANIGADDLAAAQ